MGSPEQGAVNLNLGQALVLFDWNREGRRIDDYQ